MTDSCGIKSCQEPRMSGTHYCEAHYSLVPRKLQTQFQFVLGRFLKNLGTPREKATTEDFKAVCANVSEAIQAALEERRSLG